MIALTPLVAALALAAPGWRVDLRTSGGFTGRGLGSIAVDEAGRARLTTVRGARCELVIGGDALAPLARAVRAARPGRWRATPAAPARGADRIRTALTVTRAGQRGSAAWGEEDAGAAPRDARAVADAALALLRSTPCRGPRAPAARE